MDGLEDWAKEPKIELAKAQSEYNAAMRELARIRARIQKEGTSAELRRELGAAEDQAAKTAARLAGLRNPS